MPSPLGFGVVINVGVVVEALWLWQLLFTHLAECSERQRSLSKRACNAMCRVWAAVRICLVMRSQHVSGLTAAASTACCIACSFLLLLLYANR